MSSQVKVSIQIRMGLKKVRMASVRATIIGQICPVLPPSAAPNCQTPMSPTAIVIAIVTVLITARSMDLWTKMAEIPQRRRKKAPIRVVKGDPIPVSSPGMVRNHRKVRERVASL